MDTFTVLGGREWGFQERELSENFFFICRFADTRKFNAFCDVSASLCFLTNYISTLEKNMLLGWGVLY